MIFSFGTVIRGGNESKRMKCLLSELGCSLSIHQGKARYLKEFCESCETSLCRSLLVFLLGNNLSSATVHLTFGDAKMSEKISVQFS